jgi:hypothetical protein
VPEVVAARAEAILAALQARAPVLRLQDVPVHDGWAPAAPAPRAAAAPPKPVHRARFLSVRPEELRLQDVEALVREYQALAGLTRELVQFRNEP